MLKKTINYTDFDGNSRTEELYFNMTENELLAFAFDMPDAMTESVDDAENMDVEAAGKKLLEKLGGAGIFKFIKDLVFKSYGVKSEDGRRFIKSEALSTEFTQTMAYDVFLMELLRNDEEAAKFINAVIPSNVVTKLPAQKIVPIN